MEELEALVRVRALCRSGAAKAVRTANDLSLGEIAPEVGVSPSTIFRWENGERRPTGAAALRYGALLERLLNPKRVRDTLASLFMLLLAPVLLFFTARPARSATDDLEPLLSIDDVAQICGVPRRTCERWLYERTGPASLKVGRHRRFRRSDVTAWLDSLARNP